MRFGKCWNGIKASPTIADPTAIRGEREGIMTAFEIALRKAEIEKEYSRKPDKGCNVRYIRADALARELVRDLVADGMNAESAIKIACE